jgi:hypothetical protein
MANHFDPVDPTVQANTTPALAGPTVPPAGHIGIAEASRVLGISREGVRQRIRRGQLSANKVDGQWWIVPPEPDFTPTGTPNGLGPNQSRVHPDTEPNRTPYRVLTTQLEADNRFLRQECERLHELLRAEQDTRRREVQELHVLLQRAQAQIPMPTAAARQPDDSEEQPSAQEPRRRRWWWPFGAVP